MWIWCTSGPQNDRSDRRRRSTSTPDLCVALWHAGSMRKVINLNFLKFNKFIESGGAQITIRFARNHDFLKNCPIGLAVRSPTRGPGVPLGFPGR